MKQKCFPVKMLMPSKKTGGFPLTLKQISGLMIYRKQENFSVEIRFSFKFFSGINVRPGRKCCVSHRISCILHRRHTVVISKGKL